MRLDYQSDADFRIPSGGSVPLLRQNTVIQHRWFP
ncbi:hypothetical protein HCH_06481 [Hahella chejuensis KCTC 2396]|uniref:Uncharacterized protein n=1 Tax=Hahella chejuensis (strain KCTC 2396) TaxID=349521 RepID=Q2S8A2_HAHCH|nr:hypothetical protein HCH_06481 [Hahella chejuensis KCTC 2396]